MTTEPGIDVELRSVVKRFGRFTAVNGIDLTVERGTFVTLLGPSGCGKTTTLRMIGGLEWPDSGSVIVAGRNVGETPDSARSTRMVFQSYALFPHMTVEENVAFGLKMQKLAASDISREIRSIAALLGLENQLGKYPHEMSGGQQQRVALARALVTRPRVLLLDEPLGALDLKMRKHMQTELKRLQREVGITFIYVTHDQEEALFLSDSVVVMDQGRIVQHGTAAEVYDRPASAFVADFIGEANLLPGHVTGAVNGRATVRTPLGILEGHLPAAFLPATGDRVVAAIRPERLRVDPAGRMGGRVITSGFLGSVTRITVEVAGAMLRVDSAGAWAPAAGQTVAFGLDEDAARILPWDERFTSGREFKESIG